MAANSLRATEILETHVGYLLSRLGSLSAARFEGMLAPFGITRMHFGLLKILDGAGPSSQNMLSNDLGMPPSRVVAFVDDLEEQGLVARERSEQDRRVNVIRLTSRGRAVLARANKIAIKWEDELLGDLSAAERTHLIEMLQRVAARHLRPASAPGANR